MRILVTGSEGVIGKALVPLLEGEVLTADIQGEPDVKADLAEGIPTEIINFEPEIIFHLAATFERTVEDASYAPVSFRNNVLLSHNLIHSLSPQKFIFASSYLVYENTGNSNLSESSRIKPRNFVGLAKYFTERELELTNKFQYISARIFRVYGYNSRDIISRWIQQALQGEKLTVWGLQNEFSYIFADDVAKCLVKLAQTGYSGPVNVGSPISRSVEDILLAIMQKVPIQIEVEPTQKVEKSGSDSKVLYQLIREHPRITLEEGIDRLFDYYKVRL